MIRPLIVAGLLTRVRPAREMAEPEEPIPAPFGARGYVR